MNYTTIADPTPTHNQHATVLFGICCEENMAVVNNLNFDERWFRSHLTYRQGRVWVSELDLCLVSTRLIHSVQEFGVIRDDRLPSDHAPIFVHLQPPTANMNDILRRSQELGDHAVLHNRCSAQKHIRKPIKYEKINNAELIQEIMIEHPPEVTGNIDTDIKNWSQAIYKCTENNITNQIRNPMQPNDNLQNYNEDNTTQRTRWNRILETMTGKDVWKAINWKGEIEEYTIRNVQSSSPSDIQFQSYFEF